MIGGINKFENVVLRHMKSKALEITKKMEGILEEGFYDYHWKHGKSINA